MSFFAVLLALIIEQLRPLPQGNPVHEALVAWSRWAGHNFDAGREHHTWVVWSITIVVPALLAFALHALLYHYSLVLALAWDLVVLYLTLGFRQFSHYFTDIREALEQGQEDQARRLLQAWRGLDASDLPRTELLRHVIEHALLSAHRHVFGVFFCFVLGSALGMGPVGAVIYRMADFCARYWAYKFQTQAAPTHERLMLRSRQAFAVIDYVPVRLTAAGFAVVGNFEEAVDCWRRYAGLWAQPNEGTLLAAAAGAVGVALGGQSAPSLVASRSLTTDAGPSADDADGQASTSGALPQLAHLRSVVGLVWRSVVLWMLMLALLSLANVLG